MQHNAGLSQGKQAWNECAGCHWGGRRRRVFSQRVQDTTMLPCRQSSPWCPSCSMPWHEQGMAAGWHAWPSMPRHAMPCHAQPMPMPPSGLQSFSQPPPSPLMPTCVTMASGCRRAMSSRSTVYRPDPEPPCAASSSRTCESQTERQAASEQRRLRSAHSAQARPRAALRPPAPPEPARDAGKTVRPHSTHPVRLHRFQPAVMRLPRCSCASTQCHVMHAHAVPLLPARASPVGPRQSCPSTAGSMCTMKEGDAVSQQSCVYM